MTHTDSLSGVQYALFETGLGHCGIAWGARGVTRFVLADSSPAATERRLKTRTDGNRTEEFPAPIARTVRDVQRYAQGEHIDFSSVAVDLPGVDDFRRSVYQAIRLLGWGETATYGEIARRIGGADPRDVGQALGQNPVPLIVPCHRVVGSGGKLVGFSAPGGIFTKERLLTLEGFGADAPRLPGF